MATSGSSNYTKTRNEMIYDAYAILGVYGVGRTISAEDMAFATRRLNEMVKTFQADGLHLWAKEEAYLFLADGTSEYTLSVDSSSARACYRSDAVITELTSAAAASATTLSLVSTGMTVGDFIGVVLDDDTTHWTTIATIPGATSVTITLALASAAAANNNVYTFTSRITKPLRVLSVRRVTDGPDNPVSTPLTGLSHEEFFDIPAKSTSGAPNSYYYNPDLTTGKLHIWPVPDDPEVYLEFTFERMIEDFDAATDNADFPSEWLECLTYQLATRLAPAFGKTDVLASISPMAEALYEKVSGFDCEAGSVSISPDMQ